MKRMLNVQLIAMLSMLSLSVSCRGDRDGNPTSQVKSDWEEPAVKGKTRSYVVDWACEPKQYGAIAEKNISDQEEYCEWKVIKKTATEKICRFTSSFDKKRDFHLNSRGQTPFNSIRAARDLTRLCTEVAEKRLKAGKTPGSLCSGVSPYGCVSGRNSDPEICTKVRWAAGERYKDNIEFCIDKLSPRDSMVLDEPLMQFGILTDIPENCTYAQEDKTEVVCTVPADETCFSVAGQLRLGLRVQTKETSDTEAQLPSRRECYVP